MNIDKLKTGLVCLEEINQMERKLRLNIACGTKVMFVNQNCIDTFGLEEAKELDKYIWGKLHEKLQPEIDRRYKIIEEL